MCDEVRSGDEFPRTIHRAEPDKADRIVAIHFRPLAKGLADAILLLAYHPAKPEVERGGLSVQLISRRVALFDSHDAKGFCAIRHRIELSASLHKDVHHRVAIAGR